ncbi:MAG: hypothetical protein J6A19_06065 [Oscillospiraceae bacterium]|nr:hypothetical protein [Oscillospiraceae bacterium]
MKKILSLGVAAAVLSMTAVAASALVEPTFTATPVAGEEVTVEIVANGMTQEATGFTVETTGLTYVEGSYEAVAGGYFGEGTMKFAYAAAAPAADGTVLLTLTFTVDAAADEDVAINLVPGSGVTDVNADAVVVTVVDSTPDDVTDPDDPTDGDEGEGEGEGEGEDGEGEDGGLVEDGEGEDGEGEGEDGEGEGEDGEGAGDATDGDTTDDGKGNPETGIALAVVPAVLAGAAIVVAKKRK